MLESGIVTVLAAQVRPVPFDPQGTLDKFEDEVATVVRSFPNAGLLVFPELYLAAEDPFSAREPEGYASEVAEAIPGPTTERVSKIAARARRWIVAGTLLERDGPDIFNTACVFSPEGVLAARYRKMFPWRPWETCVPGNEPCVFEVPGLGRIGLMICYDGWFPEVARTLATMGAELIVQPSLTTTPDREEELILARAHAIANQCFVLNVNAVSTIGGGCSIGVDPEGRVLFQGGAGEELILETIDLARVPLVRERGLRGLNRVWDHYLEAPPGAFGAYRDRS